MLQHVAGQAVAIAQSRKGGVQVPGRCAAHVIDHGSSHLCGVDTHELAANCGQKFPPSCYWHNCTSRHRNRGFAGAGEYRLQRETQIRCRNNQNGITLANSGSDATSKPGADRHNRESEKLFTKRQALLAQIVHRLHIRFPASQATLCRRSIRAFGLPGFFPRQPQELEWPARGRRWTVALGIDRNTD